MKKIITLLILFNVLLITILPTITFAGAPEEPPEMPDWFKDKYCKDKSLEKCNEQINNDFKGKDIKTKKPPKPIKNPTPVGIGSFILSEYILKQSDVYQRADEKFWDTIDDLDQKAHEYLIDRGLGSWEEIFDKVGNGTVQLTENALNLFNNFIDDFVNNEIEIVDNYYYLQLLEPDLLQTLKEDVYNKMSDRPMYLSTIIGHYYHPEGSIVVYFNFIDYGSYTTFYHFGYRTWKYNAFRKIPWNEESWSLKNNPNAESVAYQYGLEKFRSHKIGSISRKEYLEMNKIKDKDFTISNHGILNNPLGSNLLNPNDLSKIGDLEHGIIEIDGTDYDIINVPNPNHTPNLPPNDPNYIPDRYPIINPVYPNVPGTTPGDDIELIPDITPKPVPNPNPNPNPNPEPDNPNNPNPKPNDPPFPVAPPPEDFPVGKTCGELKLDLKSVDLFTKKFPFSLPWDIYNAIDALFGGMGNEKPEFKYEILIQGKTHNIDIKIPEFFHSFRPFINSIIVFLFDIALIYALHRLFGGAS